MNVLIIKNIASEGPGTIEDFLRANQHSYSIVEINKGEAVPSVDDFTHVIIMGGPMAVYEMDRYPWLRDEANLIERAVKARKPVLGICLGAQMIAHVLGARVYAGSAKEIGWQQVAITADGMRDGLMSLLAVNGSLSADVFQWHGDTFDLPAGSVLLASSDLFPHQAFRYADRVYALQFHIEVTPTIVVGWLKEEQGIDLVRLKNESDIFYNPYQLRAANFYRRFFAL